MPRPPRWLLLLAAPGCAREGLDDPTITLGDPAPTVVTVRFDTDRPGRGRVAWEDHGRWIVADPGGPVGTRHEVPLWLPAGERVRVRAELVTDAGVEEGRPVSVRLPDPPEELTFRLTHRDPDRSRMSDGVLVLNAYDEDAGWAWAFVLDDRARARWWAAPEDDGHRYVRARPGRDGRSVLVGRFSETHKAEDAGAIERFALGVDQERTETRAVEFHHDFVELPDGRLSWLSWVYDDRVLGPRGLQPVAADGIRVAPEGGQEGDETLVFSLLDDYPHAPFFTCDHMLPGQFAGRYWEWSHTNSLDWDEQAGAWRGLARYWDAVWEAGEDGFHWQLGGVHGTFDAPDPTRHGHSSDLVGDRFVIFDNGDHGPRPIVSRVVGLDVDLDAGTTSEAWSIPDPEGRFVSYLGDARQLPGGNVLVLWSPRGVLQEFAPDGEVVWEAELRGPGTVGRLTWTTDLAPR